MPLAPSCRRVALRSLFGVALIALPAGADPPTVAWHAPEGCGSTEDLRAAVARLLRPETTDAAYTRFDASAAPTSDGHWTLTLAAFSSRIEWSRQVHGATCSELREAAAVMIALAIEPNRRAELAEQSEPPSAPRANGGGAPASIRPAPAPRGPGTVPPFTQPGGGQSISSAEQRSSRGSAATWAIGARTGLAVGVLPKPTLAVWLGGLRAWGPWHLDGDAGWLLPRSSTAAGGDDVGARIGAAVGTLGVGIAPVRQPLQLVFCAKLQAGLMYGHSIGLDVKELHVGPWVAGATGVSVAYPAERALAAVATADAWAPVWKTAFLLRDGREIHRPEALSGMVAVGLLWRFESPQTRNGSRPDLSPSLK